ncbi:B3 DNA binding domain [Dillenia turbinata]|uniref:B3 DNA binding domain n=1 Tax=Dillenia turbinata TaxID=194707 RepID=A0AAN8YXF9_9MAGN
MIFTKNLIHSFLQKERANAKLFVKFEQVDLGNHGGTSTRFDQEAACIGNYDEHLEERRSFALDCAQDRAHEVQANLSDNGPGIVRPMLYSAVKDFWLDFPSEFSQKFMPREDSTILLEDEGGNEYKTSYEVKHLGLSEGWAAFVEEHKLQVGDALIFHLIKPHKFKVYIVRADQLSEVDGALALMSLSGQAR